MAFAEGPGDDVRDLNDTVDMFEHKAAFYVDALFKRGKRS